MCRAERIKAERGGYLDELGEPPRPPTGQWAIDAGRAAPETSFVQAELVERIDEDEEDGPSFGDEMRAISGLGPPQMHGLIG